MQHLLPCIGENGPGRGRNVAKLEIVSCLLHGKEAGSSLPDVLDLKDLLWGKGTTASRGHGKATPKCQ